MLQLGPDNYVSLPHILCHRPVSITDSIVGAIVSDFRLPWDLPAEIDFLV